MLIEFSVTNFKSIRDRQTLSLVASKSNELADTQPFDAPVSGGGDIKLLPSTAIYGANAAGKSNLLEAFSAMKIIVLESTVKLHRGALLPINPFKLDATTRNAPTKFEVIFIAGDVRYQYGFSATNERIVDEWLLAYPKNRPQHWIDRVWNKQKKKHDWSLGEFLVGEKNLWQKSTRENALFLSTAIQLNSQQLQPVFDWFKKTRMVGISACDPVFSASLCAEKNKKQKILEHLQAADLGIDNIQVATTPFDPEILPEGMPKSMRQAIAQEMKNGKHYEIQTVHHDTNDKPVVFDFNDESDGTQKFFSFAGPWVDVLTNGYVLFVDELHNNMHPKLVTYLINLFNNKKTNPRDAQLIFTTHETAILNQKVLRRDQVWFCEKDKAQATQVYPLSDFNPRKGRENLELAYLSGRYGAVPFVSSVLRQGNAKQ